MRDSPTAGLQPIPWLAALAASLDGDALRAWCLMQAQVDADGLLALTDAETAALLGVSARTAVRVRGALASAGALHLVKRTGRASLYRLTPPAGVPGPLMAVMSRLSYQTSQAGHSTSAPDGEPEAHALAARANGAADQRRQDWQRAPGRSLEHTGAGARAGGFSPEEVNSPAPSQGAEESGAAGEVGQRDDGRKVAGRALFGAGVSSTNAWRLAAALPSAFILDTLAQWRADKKTEERAGRALGAGALVARLREEGALDAWHEKRAVAAARSTVVPDQERAAVERALRERDDAALMHFPTVRAAQVAQRAVFALDPTRLDALCAEALALEADPDIRRRLETRRPDARTCALWLARLAPLITDHPKEASHA